MISTNILQSWTFAAESLTASGIPLASTTTWRFVPGLPRSVGFGPVLAPPESGHGHRVSGRPIHIDKIGLSKPI